MFLNGLWLIVLDVMVYFAFYSLISFGEPWRDPGYVGVGISSRCLHAIWRKERSGGSSEGR